MECNIWKVIPSLVTWMSSFYYADRHYFLIKNISVYVENSHVSWLLNTMPYKNLLVDQFVYGVPITVIHQNDPNDKEFYQLHWFVYVKIRAISTHLTGIDVEGFGCGLLYCIIPVSGKNDCRKTHQDITASGLTFWTRNWPRILSATNLTATIYKIMCNSSVNSSHK